MMVFVDSNDIGVIDCKFQHVLSRKLNQTMRVRVIDNSSKKSVGFNVFEECMRYIWHESTIMR